MDYDLIICQANEGPIMTEHLNKRFKDILMEMDDPGINPEEVVFRIGKPVNADKTLWRPLLFEK